MERGARVVVEAARETPVREEGVRQGDAVDTSDGVAQLLPVGRHRGDGPLAEGRARLGRRAVRRGPHLVVAPPSGPLRAQTPIDTGRLRGAERLEERGVGAPGGVEVRELGGRREEAIALGRQHRFDRVRIDPAGALLDVGEPARERVVFDGAELALVGDAGVAVGERVVVGQGRALAPPGVEAYLDLACAVVLHELAGDFDRIGVGGTHVGCGDALLELAAEDGEADEELVALVGDYGGGESGEGADEDLEGVPGAIEAARVRQSRRAESPGDS